MGIVEALRKKKTVNFRQSFFCTSGGNRTPTTLLLLDFESSASTSSATSARIPICLPFL